MDPKDILRQRIEFLLAHPDFEDDQRPATRKMVIRATIGLAILGFFNLGVAVAMMHH